MTTTPTDSRSRYDTLIAEVRERFYRGTATHEMTVLRGGWDMPYRRPGVHTRAAR